MKKKKKRLGLVYTNKNQYYEMKRSYMKNQQKISKNMAMNRK